ncbi:Basic helix-loop-helix domain-containing [Argiope bruennichi]|uniref:Basic helix-loop-helix domain-containing n=2 Tax=Argiope bruennichi TaxID=94029 RepID=A0A8T0EQC0_ARGBR|nr:Basic helix-loop-helix domain-containing [Argiope bruennichi]
MSETSQTNSDNEKSRRPCGSRKRQVHNEVERRRKDKINGWISKIGDLLPCKEPHKRSKISILEQTVDYIKLLVLEREKLLSENRSEVQAEEVKQLKRDLKLVQEQNAVYEKLLLQANISLNALPKKPLKYSDKFERKNGILTVKNSDINVNSRVDSAIQVNSDLPVNISNVNSLNTCSSIAKKPIKKTKAVVKNCKTKSLKKDKIVNPPPCVTTSETSVNEDATYVNNLVDAVSTNSLTAANTVPFGCQVSQGSAISNISCNEVVKEAPSLHTGGVTTVLSQFPLMSTTHSSSLVNMCNKNMSTIIIPTGGGILQHFPAAEKPSNTISIICPSTLPIIVPQQVFNVSSVARNVGLSSTLICSGPVNDPCSQTEKATLGNTLVTLNPGSVVPISSNITANGGIILSPQTALLGSACASGNLTQNVISSIIQPVPQMQSEQVIVPLPLKAPTTTSATATVEKSALPPQNVCTTFDKSLSDKCKSNKSPSSSLQASQTEPCEASNSSSIPTESIGSAVDGNKSNASSQKKAISVSREIRSISFSSLPSLQVLSANKIISLANQSQMSKTKLSLPLMGKESSQISSVSLLPNETKSLQSSNNFCLQIDTPGVSVNLSENDIPKNLPEKIVPATTASPTIRKDPVLTAKSNFSLNVLMGDTISDKTEDNRSSKEVRPSNSQNSIESVSKLQAVPTAYSVSTIATTNNASIVATVNCSDIPVCSIGENSAQNGNNVLNSATHFDTSFNVTVTSAGLNSEPYKSNNAKNRVEKNSSNELSVQQNNNMNGIRSNLLCNTSTLNHETSCASTSITTHGNSNTLNQVDQNVGFSKHDAHYSDVDPKNTTLTPKDINVFQNHDQNKQCSELISSAIPMDSINSVFTENVPYIVHDSSVNQNILPLLSTNQIVSMNSPAFVYPVQDNASSNVHLAHNTNVSSESSVTITTCMLPNSCSDLPSFTTLNKENISSTYPVLTIPNENSKRPNGTSTNTLSNSEMIDANFQYNAKSNMQDTSKLDNKINTSVDASKQSPNAKKKKSGMKIPIKVNTSDAQTICNSNDTSGINSSYELNKSQSAENSETLSKSDEGVCMRQESNNFLYTSDILARATESVFGSDMLENNQLPKRSVMYYTEDGSHLNIPTSSSEKQNVNFKLDCSSSNVEHIETSSNLMTDNSKKNSGSLNIYSIELTNSETTDQNNLELKQNKACKTRKSKTILDLEPPMKKMKETIDSSSKSSNSHIFTNTHQTEEEIGKRSASNSQLNMPCEEKQVSTESHASEVDHSGIDSLSHFGNQIHLAESNCKTPTSVDAIFSLTPMLGDILKDVSHGIGMETRNNGYLTCSDNQSLFLGEKSFLSLNFVTNSNDDYLNLPRMHLPVSSEISVPPVLPATNVSFAHTVSLCSTQSDTSKTTETTSSADQQNKNDPKKKNNLCNTSDNLSSLNHSLAITNSVTKSSECLSKPSNSEPSFSISAKVSNSSNSLLFDNQTLNNIQNGVNVPQSNNSAVSQTDPHFSSRDNFTSVSHGVTFYPSLSNSNNVQNFTSSSSSTLLHTNFHSSTSSNLTSLSFPVQTVSASTNTVYQSQSAAAKVDSLSHSLCSLLKETSNILGENRIGTSGPASSQASSSSSTSNISQSKYSALSLISDHSSYSESPSSSACHSEYVHSSVVCTPSVSDTQYTSNNSSCSRNQRSSLSYSAESLLQTSCANSEKSKNKNVVNNRYVQRIAEKKSDRNNITNMHSISDTNIFMPVTSCDINISNAPLVPLPPVTSFHNFPPTYTLCDSVPSTTIFNSVTRTHDIPLSLPTENFLNHMNLSVESQVLTNRHDASSTVPKPHSNITLPFENHGSLYNNCNFLPHVKPALETSRTPESGACFPPTSFSNNYSQSAQKSNYCQFPHRTLTTNPELPADISLPVGPPVPSFHTDKANFQTNRSSLQTSFSQNNANFVGNIFYNTNNTTRDVNDMTVKPSNIRPTQEAFVPEGHRQNLHDHNPIIFPGRKTATSNRSKSKKGKNLPVNEGNTNMVPSSMGNFPISQDLPGTKSNISCVPNGYFKNNSHSVIPPPPSQLPCSQHKIAENTPNTVIPTNPPFNPVLHQQGDNFFNLNFQSSNFAMSPLPRPPTQPLSCSCLTTPIISHTFSSTNHPVPNFNLSNILPDMGCSSNQVSLPPVKFPPVNHTLQSSSAQCQTNSTMSNSAHIISHQTCTPALYPPHPPMVRGSLNPILSHNPQSFSENQVPLVGTGATPVMSQNITFSASQNPTFRNVIHSLSFPRNER